MVELAREHAFISRHAVGRLSAHSFARRRVDAPRKGGDDRGRHLVLDGEDVLELPVVAVGPDMAVCRPVDQLHGTPDTISDFAHTTFDPVLNLRLVHHLTDVYALALVLDGGFPRTYAQGAIAR